MDFKNGVINTQAVGYNEYDMYFQHCLARENSMSLFMPWKELFFVEENGSAINHYVNCATKNDIGFKC